MYQMAEPWAGAIKTVLEMCVGVLVVSGVLTLAIWDMVHLRAPDETAIFRTVAGGLAVVAAIELAYTLFTLEPDEIVNPLMLGLSSALLFQVSKITDFSWSSGLAVLLFVGALASLFAVRRRYVDRQDERNSDLMNQADGRKISHSIPSQTGPASPTQ